jgi:hypothetical protein
VFSRSHQFIEEAPLGALGVAQLSNTLVLGVDLGVEFRLFLAAEPDVAVSVGVRHRLGVLRLWDDLRLGAVDGDTHVIALLLLRLASNCTALALRFLAPQRRRRLLGKAPPPVGQSKRPGDQTQTVNPSSQAAMSQIGLLTR